MIWLLGPRPHQLALLRHSKRNTPSFSVPPLFYAGLQSPHELAMHPRGQDILPKGVHPLPEGCRKREGEGGFFLVAREDSPHTAGNGYHPVSTSQLDQ